MTVGLVGNNDGPLRLLRSMEAESPELACVGIQSPPSQSLRDEYESALDTASYVEGFGEEKLLGYLEPLGVDLLINAFCNFRFRRLLNQSYEVLNVHLSPLPRYRGRHPIQWALINGETEFGVTIHRMVPEWDAGAILWQQSVPVDPLMSVEALRNRLLSAVTNDFGSFLERYEAGVIKPRSNADENATYVARRFPEDSRLTDWDDHKQIRRMVMALRSEDYPARVVVEGQPIAVRSAVPGERFYDGVAAPFVCSRSDSTLTVVCLDGHTLRLGDLTPPEPDVQVNDRITISPRRIEHSAPHR